MVEQLRIRALGPPEITVGDRIVTDLIPAKGRALLVRLALGQGPKGRSELAGLLWSDFDESAAMDVLTKAETRVLELLGEGLTNASIAQRLFVSVETVKTHVHRVLDKLGVSTRAQAALVARGLTPSK